VIEPKLSKALVERIMWQIDDPTGGWLGGTNDTVLRITKQMVESKKGKRMNRYRIFLTERYGFRVISTILQWRAFCDEPCMYRITIARMTAAYEKVVEKKERDRMSRVKLKLDDELRSWAND
tara:strand:- start:115 stop:480 length:366 start_codon:yes stop_codon:yes gene_type:complete